MVFGGLTWRKGKESKNLPDNCVCWKMKALIFLFLSLQIEAFSRLLMRGEAPILAPGILIMLGEIGFLFTEVFGACLELG